MGRTLVIMVVRDEHLDEVQNVLRAHGEARVWDVPEEPHAPGWLHDRPQRLAHQEGVRASLQRFLNASLAELDLRLTTGAWVLRRARARVESLDNVPERVRSWLLRRVASPDGTPPSGDEPVVDVEEVARDLFESGLGLTEVCNTTGLSWDEAHRIRYPPIEREPRPPLTEKSSVDELELSVRAANVLQNLGIMTIGELTQPGVIDRLRDARNLGRVTLAEIDGVMRQALGCGLGPSLHEPKKRFPCLEVPDSARSYAWAELPVSQRVCDALGRAGVVVLGDVHGMTSRGLRDKVPRLGRDGVRQVEQVIAGLPQWQALSPTELFETLDRAIAGLDPLDRDVLLLRLGANAEPVSLGDVGARLDRSREAIRQMEPRALARLRALAGPEFGAALREWLASGGALTALRSTRPSAAKPSYSAGFYARLVARLRAVLSPES
jgi:DNA-directed RNA polymerase specialized sigma24 family protein